MIQFHSMTMKNVVNTCFITYLLLQKTMHVLEFLTKSSKNFASIVKFNKMSFQKSIQMKKIELISKSI